MKTIEALLNRLGDERVLSIVPVPNSTTVIFYEECDSYFYSYLDKEELALLGEYLISLSKREA
jgi:hypothetical protein